MAYGVGNTTVYTCHAGYVIVNIELATSTATSTCVLDSNNMAVAMWDDIPTCEGRFLQVRVSMGQSGVLIQSVVEMLCARAKWDRKDRNTTKISVKTTQI